MVYECLNGKCFTHYTKSRKASFLMALITHEFKTLYISAEGLVFEV